MTAEVQLALIAVFGSLLIAVIGPLLLSWLNARNVAAKEKRDNDRQDLVAERAASAQRETAALLRSNEVSAKATLDKLDVIHGQNAVIHTLVNSQMTAAMQAQLDSLVGEVAMMREVVDLKHELGQKPTPVAQRAIDMTDAKIAELQSQLADRATAAEQVAVQEQTAYAEGIGTGPTPL